MDTRSIIGIIAGIIAFSSYFFYIPSIIKGKTKPNRASWWIWGFLGTSIAISYYISGARTTMWVPLSEAVGPLLVALLSIKYGEGGWTRFDKKCIVGAAGVGFLWWVTSSSIIALVSYLLIDIIAVLPTIRKSLHRPENEDKIAWGLTFTGQFLNIFAVEKLIFSILIYPIVMIITNGTIFGLLFRKKGDKAFSSIDIVSQCLSDIPRTTAFQKAINQNIKKDDIVLEIGAGSGIFSLFASRSGAKKVVALEFDPFIAEVAKKVIDANNCENIEIRIANGCNYRFEPGLCFDVVIMEMLTTGMIDEYQVAAVNNLHNNGVVSKKTVFTPYKQETFVTLGNFKFECYELKIPLTRHLWKFYDHSMREFETLTEKILLNSIDFSTINKEWFNANMEVRTTHEGIINCVYLSSLSYLNKDIILNDTDSLNGPVVVPISERYVKQNEKIILSVKYKFGGGYENFQAIIN